MSIPSILLSNERTPRVPLAGVATIAFPANMKAEKKLCIADKTINTSYQILLFDVIIGFSALGIGLDGNVGHKEACR